MNLKWNMKSVLVSKMTSLKSFDNSSIIQNMKKIYDLKAHLKSSFHFTYMTLKGIYRKKVSFVLINFILEDQQKQNQRNKREQIAIKNAPDNKYLHAQKMEYKNSNAREIQMDE